VTDRSRQWLLLASVFVIATCGLVYELIAGTLASYLLGDSVTQFSTVIGAYLFSMGVGSWLSKFVHRNEGLMFVRLQIGIGVFGGSSAAVLFSLFPVVSSFRAPLFALLGIVGAMVGLEIPLMLRILSGRIELKDLVARVFALDYVGALLASLIFPLVLAPRLGLVRTSFMFGVFNVVVALATLRLLGPRGGAAARVRAGAWTALAVLVAGFVFSDRLLAWTEAEAFVDPVIYSKSSPYQRVVLTRSRDDLRLYLNGNLQFSSRDEYRYHEALVHVGLSRLPDARRVLVLGGGDGLAVREILKYPGVSEVVLVDLDAAMTRLFASQSLLTNLNLGSLASHRVRVVNEDAFSWLAAGADRFDFAVVDFPDPSTYSIGKLYTTAFYRRLRTRLTPGGAMVIQCTSPYVARRAFWCVDSTLKASGLVTEPYHLYVPSFGEWGFILAGDRLPESRARFPAGLKYVNAVTAAVMRDFPPDMDPVDVEPNRLNNQVLVRYFEEEWANYVH
jgi:spermidine synthase